MALRVIEIVTPAEDKGKVQEALEEHRPDMGYYYWCTPLSDEEGAVFRLVLDAQETETVMDTLEYHFAWSKKYRVVVYPAEATLPRLDATAERELDESDFVDNVADDKKKSRISREELYADVLDTTLLSRNYIMLIIFASMVAVIGLLRDSVAIIIGAMVLAPLLGPNVGLSLATTLGDKKLSLESVKTLTVGVVICLAISGVTGLILGAPDGAQELTSRAVVTYSDIILAIVSGAAGIISFTLGVPTSLVGVMVALALLPPLAASGIYIGAGQFTQAWGAMLLFMTNIISLNLAGVVTFLLQGVRPLSWGEKEVARAASIRAGIIWTVLLAIIIAVVAYKVE